MATPIKKGKVKKVEKARKLAVPAPLLRQPAGGGAKTSGPKTASELYHEAKDKKEAKSYGGGGGGKKKDLIAEGKARIAKMRETTARLRSKRQAMASKMNPFKK